MDGFDFTAEPAESTAPLALDGFDFTAPAPVEPVEPVEPAAEAPPETAAPAAEGDGLGMLAGFQTEEDPKTEEPATEAAAFTMNSFNPKLAEIEEKTQKERQERQNAASMKESEMKQAAATALEKFHADRKAAAATKLQENLAAEKAAADALASETNPWNTVYGMVEGSHVVGSTGGSQKHSEVLASLQQKGKA